MHHGNSWSSGQGLHHSQFSQTVILRSESLHPILYHELTQGILIDSNGNPRPVVNSKGRRRRPGSKTLAQALRCNDEDFVDFIAKCLVWDPERRLKPQAAMRHPFITAGRRFKPSSGSTTAKSLLSASTLTGRSKQTFETPKKSQISAPTPLTARSIRTTNAMPSTPQHANTIISSSRSYRASQSHSLSSYHSSRTLNGVAVSDSWAFCTLEYLTAQSDHCGQVDGFHRCSDVHDNCDVESS